MECIVTSIVNSAVLSPIYDKKTEKTKEFTKLILADEDCRLNNKQFDVYIAESSVSFADCQTLIGKKVEIRGHLTTELRKNPDGKWYPVTKLKVRDIFEIKQ